MVEVSQQLALKVEGVIQHENTQSFDSGSAESSENGHACTHRMKFRNVDKLKLTLKKHKQGASKHTNVKVSCFELRRQRHGQAVPRAVDRSYQTGSIRG